MHLLSAWINERPALYERAQRAANFFRTLPRALLDLMPQGGCDSVLEIGCGTGELVDHLAPTVTYTGVDRNARFVAYARETRRGTWVEADVTRAMPALGRAFHTVVFLGVLHHLDDDEVIAMWTHVRPFAEQRVIVMEPYRPDRPDLRYSVYAAIEQGAHVRTPAQWRALFARMGLVVDQEQLITMALPISRKIVCALSVRFV